MKKNKIKNNEKKIKNIIITKAIIFFILISLIMTAVILYNKNDSWREIIDIYLFRKEKHEDNLPYIEIDSSKVVGMHAYDEYIAILQGNKLDLYNKYGKIDESLEIEITSPIFESNGKYMVVAEKNGQKLYFINNKSITWNKDIEGKISSININKNGYVTIIILGTSYKTVIKTFDAEGNELFTNYLAKTNVVDTDISNDNKYLAIAEVNSSGIVVQSTVKIISIEDAKNNTGNSIKYTHISNSGDLITNIKYQNKNNLICMYDEHIDVLNNDQNTKLVDLKEKDSLFADINLTSKVIKIIKKKTGILSAETELEIINTNTKEKTIYEIEDIPKLIQSKNSVIAINLGTKVLFIKDNGWLQKKYESSREIQEILLCENIAGIVLKNKIEIISL